MPLTYIILFKENRDVINWIIYKNKNFCCILFLSVLTIYPILSVLIYINDHLPTIRKSQEFCFADDIKFISQITGVECTKLLQEGLYSLQSHRMINHEQHGPVKTSYNYWATHSLAPTFLYNHPSTLKYDEHGFVNLVFSVYLLK